MRTTLTLDDELARDLKKLSRQTGLSFKEIVNATLRRGLAQGEKPSPSLPRFKVEARDCELRVGVDPYRFNQLNDEIELGDFLSEPERAPA